MTTKVQKKSNAFKKVLKRFLQLFIRFEILPISYDGRIKEHFTMYLFGKEFCSGFYETSKKG